MTGQVFTADEIQVAFGQAPSYLGTGSFGETWRVGDSAMKVIHDVDYPMPRLEREVSGLRRVHHPGVVSLIDVREVDLRGQSHSVLEFEFINGGDLQSRFDSGVWPSQDAAEALLVGLLEAIHALHSCRTVHRDIKPANIALRDGAWSSPVLLDLGLSRNLDDSTLTVYPTFLGTPGTQRRSSGK